MFRNGFLVFLTGQEEIDAACKMIEKYSKEFKNKIFAIPLYSSVNLNVQNLAFALPPSVVFLFLLCKKFIFRIHEK